MAKKTTPIGWDRPHYADEVGKAFRVAMSVSRRNGYDWVLIYRRKRGTRADRARKFLIVQETVSWRDEFGEYELIASMMAAEPDHSAEHTEKRIRGRNA